MSASLSYGGNTATSPATGARTTIVPAAVNFNADWRVVSESSNEVILTHITSTPQASPLQLRIAYSEIADVFKGTKIEKTGTVENPNPTARGVSVLVQLTGGMIGAALGQTQYFPFSCHLVLKLPVAPDVDADCIESILNLLLGTLYDTKATVPDSRLLSMLRGATTPTDL